MKNLLVRRIAASIGFCLLFFLLIQGYFRLADNAVYSRAGLSTEEQLEMQFENAIEREYDCLIIGNSRTYRGINPDMLSMSAYNFSHDNDNYNQMYWKLIYLEESNVDFDAAIISTDYFMFGFLEDSRNAYYGKLLPTGYMADYENADIVDDAEDKKKWFEKMNDMFNAYIVKEFQQPLTYVVETLSSEKTQQRYLNSNGQYIDLASVATDADTLTRNGSRLEIQMQYFEKILAYCKEKGIRVAVVMPPAREIEMANYTPEFLEEFDGYLENTTEKYDAILLNYAYDTDFKETQMYTDTTHLRPHVADQWTQKLNADLSACGFYQIDF